MAYVKTINYVVNDTMPDVSVIVRDSSTGAVGVTYDENNSDTWAPIDLTDLNQVFLRIRKLGETTISQTVQGIVADAAAGKVLFNFANDPFTSSGTFEGEVELTYDDGGKQTLFDLIKFKVREDFD